MQLCEKYRPRTWADFIGQPKIIARVRAILSRPDFGQGGGDCFWISGASGTGKTSLGKLIAADLGCDPFWGVQEEDGKHVNASVVRDIERWLWLQPPSGGWKVVLINEGQSIRDGAVEAFLGLLERIPAKRLIIFTSTTRLDTASTLFGDEFTSPMARRCKRFDITNQGLAELMAKRAYEVANAEGLNGKPFEHYLRGIKDSHNSLGDLYQRIEALEFVA